MNTSKLIWFAIVASTVIYFALAWTLGQQNAGQPLAAAFFAPMVLPLYACAVAAFLAATVIGLTFRRLPPQTTMIMRLAFSEAAVIFGLIAVMLAHDWRLYLPTWFVAAVGFAGAFPKDEPAS